MNVSIKDFQPYNHWIVDISKGRWSCCVEHQEEGQFIVDQTTKRNYLNESKGKIRFKCLLLSLSTPFIQPLFSIGNVVYRIFKALALLIGAIFTKQPLKQQIKLIIAGQSLLQVIVTPLGLIGMELASIYGMCLPYDGRKLYASLERLLYGDYVLAPCFQPNPKCHAFGGNLNQKNAF